MAGTQRRVGVYVCHCGGNISDVVDVQRVVDEATRLDDVVVTRREMFMCSDPGQKSIADDIAEHHLDRVVVAACSPSLHETTFRGTLKRAGLNPFLYEHANIREQVSWCHKHDPEGATRKAARLVTAAVAKARHLVPLEPVVVPATRSVAVIGAGIAGLRAALDLAAAGFEIHLVERAAEPGGHLDRPGRLYPTDQRARDLLTDVLAQTLAEPAIHLHLGAEVTGSAGCLGNFRLTIRTGEGATEEVTVGALLLATGFDHYRPSEGEYGFGVSDRVITLPDLIERLDATGPTGGRLVVGGETVRSVAFLHCVGSRQQEGVHTPLEGGRLNEHCSRVCCTATLRAAVELHTALPDVNIYDIYQDIRTYGRGQEDIHEAAARAGVTFFRVAGDQPPAVEVRSDGRLAVRFTDILTFNEELELPVDLVVLATGMVPCDIASLVEMLKLPRSPDGFLQEAHPKLRPVEISVDGVFIAGTCQAPMDVAETCAAASAAASKAASLLGSGEISLSPFVATIDPARCDGCGLCLAECAFSCAITVPEGSRIPVVNPAICKGCGMCMAVCPPRAITVRGWELDQFEAMVDAIVEVWDG